MTTTICTICPGCGSDNVKNGAAASPTDVRDFGCRDCGAGWNAVDVLPRPTGILTAEAR